MVYGYKTNEEFINKSYQLLEKLDDKGLWNKDTLVVGLDKSVRPLAYALRKISNAEKRDSPDIKFFNYTSHGEVKEKDKKSLKLIREKLKNNFRGYKKVLILDDHIWSGNSLRNAKILMDSQKIFPENIDYSFAALQLFSNSPINDKKKQTFIFADYINPKNLGYSSKSDLLKDRELNNGVKDKNSFFNRQIFNKKEINQTKRIRGRQYKRFIQNRRQLSGDIKDYLHEKHPEKIKEKLGTLERIISGIFLFSFLFGLFFSSGNLTGNVIGNYETGNKFLGIVLILFGVGGFFVYRKIKKF